METCNVTVRHKGKLTSSVRRRGVTPPEAVLLMRLHGNDALVEYELNPEPIKTDHIGEIERLRDYYGISAENLRLIDEAFPGHSPKLPEKFSEIGVTIESVAKRAKRSRTTVDTAEAAEEVLA